MCSWGLRSISDVVYFDAELIVYLVLNKQVFMYMLQ